MQIELRALSLNDGQDIREMLTEIGPGENGFHNEGYGMEEIEFRDYLHLNINSSKGIDLEPGRVPQTMYWLYVNGKPAGYGKVREYLNDELRKIGGHIGYCIRPAARGKGYGNIILGELLNKAREKNIPRALLTCLEGNTPSRRIIEYNGGRLDRIENGECYYWIRLSDPNGIRELHVDDYNEVYALWERIPGVDLSEADSPQNMKAFLIRNKGLSFCYGKDGKLIRTVLCCHDGRRGYLYHVAVDEALRGRHRPAAG
jgi:predicted acetyltransferase